MSQSTQTVAAVVDAVSSSNNPISGIAGGLNLCSNFRRHCVFEVCQVFRNEN